MKICRICGEEKPTIQFNFRVVGGKRQNHCKMCQKEISRRSYLKHRDRVLARTKKKNAARREMLKEILKAHKNGAACKICGEDDPVTFDFHHRDPSKKAFNICDAVKRCVQKKALLAELAKCIILCANCHRKVNQGKVALA